MPANRVYMMSNVQCLVPISGGKDSQLCLKLATMFFPLENIRGLFCDTQFEHPLTYAHVEKLRTLYGDIQIDTVTGGSVLEKSLKYGRFPGGGARHCTDELKIRETKIYARELARQQGTGFEVWYGMRSAESPARKKRYKAQVDNELHAPHEVMPGKYPKYLQQLGVMFRLPIINWTDAQVFRELGGQEHPFYALGFPRVGCFPCLASAPQWQKKAFEHDDFGREQWQRVEIVARQINKDPFKGAGLACSVCSI